MIDNPHAVPAPTAADLERWYTGHGRMVVVIQEAGVFHERPMTPAELAAREPAYRIAMTIHHLASYAALSYIRVWEVISAAMEIGDYAHDARVTELLEANNREVERRRAAEARVREAEDLVSRLAPHLCDEGTDWSDDGLHKMRTWCAHFLPEDQMLGFLEPYRSAKP